MKNTVKVLGFIALVALIGFSMAACDVTEMKLFNNNNGNDNSNELSEGSVITFTSIADFKGWLFWQRGNTYATAYSVKLNVSDLGGDSHTDGSVGNALGIYTTNKYVSIDLSDSNFTSIGDDAFNGCTGLTCITIPNSVTSIGKRAFVDCYSLASVAIPDSVTSIGDFAFYGCINLIAINVDTYNTAYSSQDGILYNKAKITLIQYPAGKTTGTFTIPDSVSSIGTFAFAASSVTSITIPNSVTSIGDYAFGNCSGLTSITIPNSVTSIGGGVFSNCTNLPAINVDAGNSAYLSQDGVLYNKAKTTLIQYPAGKTTGTFIIPNSVTSIEQAAFYGCDSLTSVTIPDSVTSIEQAAFYGCTSLTSVTIGNGVTSIGGYAFSYCDSLASVTIGNSVTSIGGYAFSYCDSLASVIIGSGVTSIGDYAFSYCTSLTSVTFQGTIAENNFGYAFGYAPFPGYIGDLRDKYLAGGIGTYTRRPANGGNGPMYFDDDSTWTKQ